MGGLELRLMLWDTAGQEEFHSITRIVIITETKCQVNRCIWSKYISLALVEDFNFWPLYFVCTLRAPFRTELPEIYMFLKPLYLHIIMTLLIGSSSKFDKPQIP